MRNANYICLRRNNHYVYTVLSQLIERKEKESQLCGGLEGYDSLNSV